MISYSPAMQPPSPDALSSPGDGYAARDQTVDLLASEAFRNETGHASCEAALRESEARYTSLFEYNHAPILLIDPASGRIGDANAAACSFYGYTRAALASMFIGEINMLPPDELAAAVRRAHGKERRQFDFRHRLATGEVRDVEVFSGPIQIGGQELLYSIVHDVTARRAAEEALRRSEERWQRLVETSPVGIVVSVEDRMVYVNAAGFEMLGSSSVDDLIGQHFSDFVASDYRNVYWSRLEAASLDKASEPILYPVRGRDGRDRYLEAVMVPADYQGCAATQIILLDATARQAHLDGLVEAKRRAEEISRLQSAFLANMSHEIRTPLTAILGLASLLADEVEDKQRELVDLIHANGERLMDTLASLYDLARLESGELRMLPEVVDVGTIVREAVDTFRGPCAARGIQLMLQVPVSPVDAHLDRRALTEVVRHLLSNAVKFTSAGAVAVVVTEDSTHVAIEVADTGIGISRGFMLYLFDPFRQESVGIARLYEGIGLGLAVSRRLVESMGGTILSASEKGLGATFTVTLPRYLESSEAPW